MKKTIRRNCFWYRPWRDMSATIDQCYFCYDGECPCHEDCEKFISKAKADELVYTILPVLSRKSCEGCIHETKGPTYYCDECERNWEDKYEKE